MFRNKGGRQKLSNNSFDDDDQTEGGGFLANTSPLNRDQSSPESFGTSPPVNDPSKLMMKAAQDMGSVSGTGSLGMAAHTKQLHIQPSKPAAKLLSQPSGGMGDLSEQPKQLNMPGR